MHARMLCFLALIGILAGESSLQAEPTPIMPLESVRRGQKGYGLTTFQGSKPEKFEFEVIGISHNFLPKMDIILVKSDDPKVQVSGFWQGMSGSPLFIDGKLVCAFSYGFRFSKRPIGGCTPIETMREEGLGPRRLVPRGKKGKKIDVPTRRANVAWNRRDAAPANILELLNHRGPPQVTPLSNLRPQSGAETHGMQPAAIPFALSGFTTPAIDAFKDMMGDLPFEPVISGGTGIGTRGPTRFEMGGPIAVQFIRGDMSAAATGTVSWVDGDDILAFGHPMFHSGEIYAPVSSAEVHAVIPSAMSAFVLASPLRELGSLTQDRQSTIAADTRFKVRMIPLSIRIRNTEAKTTETFNVEILNNRLFTGNFAILATTNAIARHASDKVHVTATLKSQIKVRGFKALNFIDAAYSSTGAEGTLAGSRALRILGPLMKNAFSPVEIESLKIDLELSYEPSVGQIDALRLPIAELQPGKKNAIDVTLEHLHRPKTTKRLYFDVPKNLAGSMVKLSVSSGDEAPLGAAPPTNLSELMAVLQSAKPANTYAVTLTAADQGAAHDGHLIRDLPASAQDRLRSSTQTQSPDMFFPTHTIFTTSDQVLVGESSILVSVADLQTSR